MNGLYIRKTSIVFPLFFAGGFFLWSPDYLFLRINCLEMTGFDGENALRFVLARDGC